MMVKRFVPGWSLLFVAGVLTAFLFLVAERPSPHSAGEASSQDCALEDDRTAAPDPCAEAATRDWNRRAEGETAWPTPC